MPQSKKETGNAELLGDIAPSPLLCKPLLISDCPKGDVSRRSYIWDGVVDRLVDKIDGSPWATIAGTSSSSPRKVIGRAAVNAPLYTPEERRRRDASGWTTVQGVLAPLQFAVFLVSLWLVISYLSTGEGLFAATVSIVAKTLFLYAIMITGSIWEREVFGLYLFARPFFWEDVVSIGVLALHTAYLCALALDLDVQVQMTIALLAYASYVINATQFVLKLRAARLGQGPRQDGTRQDGTRQDGARPARAVG